MERFTFIYMNQVYYLAHETPCIMTLRSPVNENYLLFNVPLWEVFWSTQFFLCKGFLQYNHNKW